MRTLGVGSGWGIVAAALMAAAPIAMAEPIRRSYGPAPRQVYQKSPRLNRSRHWPFAETYEEARAMSPSSRTVR